MYAFSERSYQSYNSVEIGDPSSLLHVKIEFTNLQFYSSSCPQKNLQAQMALLVNLTKYLKKK